MFIVFGFNSWLLFFFASVALATLKSDLKKFWSIVGREGKYREILNANLSIGVSQTTSVIKEQKLQTGQSSS